MAGYSVALSVALLLLLGITGLAVGRKPKAVIIEPKGILKPQDSESRIVKSLDGLWKFRVAPMLDPEIGFVKHWFKHPLELTGEVQSMPVPSSYNDITESQALRDHVGWVWYQREFFVNAEWLNGKQRIFLRVGAANYRAIVYVNGEQVATHAGGSLPFEVELSLTLLKGECVNLVTIAVDNRLTANTVPQGTVTVSGSSVIQETVFDFFNYAGISRSVVLYLTPRTYIDDINVSTRIVGTTGYVKYSIKAYADAVEVTNCGACVVETSEVVEVKLVDKCGTTVAIARGASGEIKVAEANLWWPFTMVHNNSMAGYQYTLVVTLTDTLSSSKDVYRLKVGIRSIHWSSTGFLINGKSFYFRGVGHHEEAEIRGRGLDEVTLVKDYNVMEWLGVNSYRSTHYPPSEEALDIADELGIVVIEETAAVSLSGFGSELLVVHKQQITEMIQRDKNRASIVMWSVAHEPDTAAPEAASYFRTIIEYTKSLDASRPVTLVTPMDVSCANDLTVQYVDIISLNRYYGFYIGAGNLDVITKSVFTDVEDCARLVKKPILFAEYGVPAVAGLHRVPSFIYTEEYQTDVMRRYFKAFDQLRVCEHVSLIGEMIFAFADFATKQQYWRVDGNKAGVMTRERQPKAAAHLLRQRYFLLALSFSNYPLPDTLPSFLPVYGSRFEVETSFTGPAKIDQSL